MTRGRKNGRLPDMERIGLSPGHNPIKIKVLCAICSKELIETPTENFDFAMGIPGSFMMVCKDCEPTLEKIIKFATKEDLNPLLDYRNSLKRGDDKEWVV